MWNPEKILLYLGKSQKVIHIHGTPHTSISRSPLARLGERETWKSPTGNLKLITCIVQVLLREGRTEKSCFWGIDEQWVGLNEILLVIEFCERSTLLQCAWMQIRTTQWTTTKTVVWWNGLRWLNSEMNWFAKSQTSCTGSWCLIVNSQGRTAIGIY